MDKLIEEVLNEAKLKIDVLPFWQQDALQRLITDAIVLAYKQGREDQKYASEGPQISLYD